jgi:hypothetical protein
MDEWAKAAISTFLGFIAGLIAEPIKAAYQSTSKLHELRRLLYRDLVNVEFAVEAIVSLDCFSDYMTLPNDYVHFADLRTDVFDWAYGTQKNVFYRMPEFQPFIFIYSKIARYSAFVPADEGSFVSARSALNQLLSQIHDLERDGVFNKKQITFARSDLQKLTKRLG